MAGLQTKIEITTDTSKYERAMNRMQHTTRKTTQFVSSSWIAVAGSIYGVAKAWDAMKMGARAQQEMKSFEALANSVGANADYIIMKLKQASANTVDTMTLVNKAGTAMLMGIDPERTIKLMEIARATSKMTGQTVAKAFGDISLAVARVSPRILDNLGLIVKIGEANAAYARTLGKTAGQLTEMEQKQAFMNATMEAGEGLMRRLNNQTKSTAEMFQSLEALARNVWEFTSQLLLKTIKWVVMIYAQAGKTINLMLASITQWIANLSGVIARIPGASALGFDDLSAVAQNVATHFRDAAAAANEFTLELFEMENAPAPKPFMPSGGAGDGGGADTETQGMLDYQKNIIVHDAAKFKDLWLAREKGMVEANRRAEEMLAEQEAAAFAEREQRQLDHYTRQGEMLQETYGDQELARWEHNDRMVELDEQYAQQVAATEERIVALKDRSANAQISIAQGLAQAAMAQFGASSTAMFVAMKAFELGKAIVGVHSAAAQALAVPPAPNFALHAATLKVGYTEVAAIIAQSIGQMAASGSGGGYTGGGSYTSPVVTTGTGANQQDRMNTENPGTTIIIEGDMVGDEAYVDSLVEKINQASDRNVFINKSVYAREVE